MLFTSSQFIAFMAVVLLAYYLVPKKAQWPLLLVASYVFYWCASPWYLLFIGVTTVSTYGISRLLERVNATQKAYLAEHKAELDKEQKKAYKAKMKAKKWHLLLLCLIFNLGILSVTKYTNFVITNINAFLSGSSKLALVDMIVPLGISFYTFQSMGYIIDVYRDKQSAQKNFFKLALFVSFFPQLAQGPISRYGDLSKTLYEPHRFERKTVSYGLMRILWGYFKKVVIADRLVTGVIALVGGQQYNGAYVFVAMLFYAFQLYCDFTGGIDITIGIAQTMGIQLTENFKLPYFSKNIKEYWNRWHITMGSWFTDYIFYPISVCKPMLKLSKWSREHLGSAVGKRVTVYLSSFAVWLTTGIWHGAAWNFIVWGIMNWVVIMASQELEPLYAKFHSRFKVKGKAPYEVFQIIRTILLMSAIRMFDCYRDVPLTFKKVGSIFTTFNWNVLVDGSLLNIGLSMADYGVLLAGLAIVFGVSLYKYRSGKSVRDGLYAKHQTLFYTLMGVLLVLILIFGAYGIGFDSSQFIYSQF
jgi:D-alanyl-lipoteichoic acid acyltransferase DltB (MBOAT superfamily)